MLTVEESQTIWTSPASDWSSMRPLPSPVSQSRPDAPERSADPAFPSRAPEGISLFVNAILAVTPFGFGAESASWIAWSSGFGGGVGPPPSAASAITVPPAANAAMATISRARLRVERVRRSFTEKSFRATRAVIAPVSESSLRAAARS